MQDLNELNKIRLERLNLRLAEVEAERDRIRKEAQALSSSLREATSTAQLGRAAISAAGILAIAALLATSVFHYAQSSVKKSGQPEVSAVAALPTAHNTRDEHLPTSSFEPASRTGAQKTFVSAIKATGQRQWGPLLVLPEPVSSDRYYGFNPLVKAQQEDLLTLGFDLGEPDGYKGPRTRRAFEEFRALYLPESARELEDADLAVLLDTYANLARSDAARFGLDPGIVAAIRLSSVRTGVDFPYLMKLAATESDFEPASMSATSSATGLYQFTHDTWLNVLKTHGAKYGLVGDYAAKIEHYETRGGYRRPIVRDETMYRHLLELRKNPRLSAMMVAETVRDNQRKLVDWFKREPTETDLYLTHFLGADDAIAFLRSLEQSPDTHAVELFPEAARSNHNIFHPRTCAPRTVDEVYALFGEKFRTRRYEDFASN